MIWRSATPFVPQGVPPKLHNLFFYRPLLPFKNASIDHLPAVAGQERVEGLRIERRRQIADRAVAEADENAVAVRDGQVP